MAYTFAHLIGHDKAKRLLRRAVRCGRVAHAYLFSGPAGVGKKRAALTLIAWLNCRTPQGEDACGECSSCKKLAAGTHPDCTLIDPEDGAAIKIDQIRQLQKDLAFPPNEGRIRAAVLVDIGRLGVAAANSLLKTLEEPPDSTVLVLTAEEGAPVLDTIVSRCQVIPFTPLPEEAVARYCTDQMGIPAEAAAAVAGVSGGSIGKAGVLHEKKILDLRAQVVEAIDRYAPEEPAGVPVIVDLARRTADLEEHLPDFLFLLSLWLRDRLLAANGLFDRFVNRDLEDHILRPKKSWPSEAIHQRLGRIDLARRQLAANCNRLAVCESLFFALL